MSSWCNLTKDKEKEDSSSFRTQAQLNMSLIYLKYVTVSNRRTESTSKFHKKPKSHLFGSMVHFWPPNWLRSSGGGFLTQPRKFGTSLVFFSGTNWLMTWDLWQSFCSSGMISYFVFCACVLVWGAFHHFWVGVVCLFSSVGAYFSL